MAQLDFDFGVAADTGYDEDGHPEIGIDHYGPAGEAGGAKVTHSHPYGFDSRPTDPNKTSDGVITEGAGLLSIRDGDHMNAIPLEDPRVVTTLPKLRKGGSRQYCADGNYAMFEGEDPASVVRPGSYVASVKYESGDGATKAHVLRMDKRTKGKEQVSFLHGEGHGIVLTGTKKKSASLRNTKGDAGFETNDEGNVISGKTKIVGSCAVGEPVAAQALVVLPVLLSYLTQLEAACKAAIPPIIIPPAALLAEAMGTKFLKGS